MIKKTKGLMLTPGEILLIEEKLKKLYRLGCRRMVCCPECGAVGRLHSDPCKIGIIFKRLDTLAKSAKKMVS